MNNIMKPHTWKFYALTWLVYFGVAFGMDWLIHYTQTRDIKQSLIWTFVEATVFTAIWWIIEEKPFKKNK